MLLTSCWNATDDLIQNYTDTTQIMNGACWNATDDLIQNYTDTTQMMNGADRLLYSSGMVVTGYSITSRNHYTDTICCWRLNEALQHYRILQQALLPKHKVSLIMIDDEDLMFNVIWRCLSMTTCNLLLYIPWQWGVHPTSLFLIFFTYFTETIQLYHFFVKRRCHKNAFFFGLRGAKNAIFWYAGCEKSGRVGNPVKELEMKSSLSLY